MKQRFGARTSKQCAGDFLNSRLGRGTDTPREQFVVDFEIDDRTLCRWISQGVNKLDVIDDIADYFGVSTMDVITYGDDVHHFLTKKTRDHGKVTFSVIPGSLFLCYSFVVRNRKANFSKKK